MSKTLEQSMRELDEAKRNLWQAFLNTGLGKLLIWCVESLNKFLKGKE